MTDDVLEVDDGESFLAMGQLLGVPVEVDASLPPGAIEVRTVSKVFKGPDPKVKPKPKPPRKKPKR